MSDETESVVARVTKALSTSGYPLEMRVANVARQHTPNYVHQSRYYVDPLSSKIRETDVLACWMSRFRDPLDGAGVWTAVYLAIECKSKPAPWVIFDEGGAMTDDPELRLDLSVSREALETKYLRRMLEMRAASNTLLGPSRIGTGIAEPTAKANELNPAWSAVQSAVSAAHGFMSDAGTFPSAEGDEPINILVQPVVVTSGVLCRAYLDDAGEIQVEEIERGEVTVRPTEDARLTRCLVVRETYVAELMQLAAQTSQFYGYP